MAKHQPIKKQPIVKPITKKVNKASSSVSTRSIFEYLENHFTNNRNWYLILLVLISCIFSLLCFDNKISTANDDALYIESGARYANAFFAKTSWYTANAPLYPIVLGLIIKVIGVRLMWLKMFSVISFAAAIYFIFRAYEKRIPYLILIPSLLLTAINFEYLMYASLTYTETFSLMIIGICFILIFKIFDKLQIEGLSIKDKMMPVFILGALCLLLMLTRSVALGAIGVVVLYLVYRKNYKEAVLAVASFVIVFLTYKFLVDAIWQPSDSQFKTQIKLMYQKDVYNPQLGDEDLSGFIVRFWKNCEIYISSRFMFVLGFREEMAETNTLITIICIALVLWSLYLAHISKQYTLLFTTLFVGAMLAVTFITLNVSWGQTRLIMIYLPFILFTVFYILYYYGQKISMLQILYPFVFFILFFVSINATLKQVKERLPIFVENVSGDPTYGYTPDWQNYIKMSKWCAENFPNETKAIAVRKAPMSFIFSEGKEFYPIYSTPTSNPDSLLMPFIHYDSTTQKIDSVKYLMTAELRANPAMYVEGQIIGTMHRYAYYVMQKYPNSFVPIHQEGDIEEAILYKINWNYIDSLRNSSSNSDR